MKDNFILYLTYYDAVMQLTDAQAGQLLKGLYEFSKTGERREFNDPTVSFAYSLITAQIEASNKQYESTCQRNRENIMKRWNTKSKAVNEGNNSNTTEYDGIRPNTTEYEEKSGIPKIDKIDKIDRKKEEEYNEKKTSLCVDTHSSDSSVMKEILNYWNEAVTNSGSVMNRLRGLTDKRKAALRARMREHKPNGLEAVKAMVDRAVRSDFLNGKNSRNSIFTFDRLIAPEMFQKTLEGNFDNKAQAAAEQPQSGIGQLMEQQQAEQKSRQQEQRERFAEMIEAVRKNPTHVCRNILVEAAKNGTLTKLGLTWQP